MASKRMMIIAVLVAAVVIVAAVAVTLNNTSAKTVGPTDALGRTVSNATVPLRIVSCAPAITEMVYSLGHGDQLVAVTDYCDYPAEVVQAKVNSTIQSIGNYKNPNFDKIVQMQPDLVILINDAEGHSAMASTLDNAHIRNIVLYECTNISVIYSNLEILGNILHCKTQAEAKILDMQGKMQYVRDHITTGSAKASVMFAVWLSPTYVAGNNTFIDDVIGVAGGVNAFSTSTGYVSVADESILQANPDVIIVTATMMSSTEKTPEQIRDEIISNHILNRTNACKNGKVFILMYQAEDAFLRPSTRVTDGAGLIARMLYPADFGGAIPYIIETDYQSYLPSYN